MSLGSIRGYGGRVSVTVPFGVPSELVAERLREFYDKSVAEGLRSARERILEEFRGEGSPVPARTGKLRRSIFVTVDVSRGELEISFLQPYSGIVDRGAEPHVIVPRKAKVLVFRDKSGKLVFTKRVDHPGFEGVDYAEKVRKRAREIVREELSLAFWFNRSIVEHGA